MTTYQPINAETAYLPTTTVFPKDDEQRLIEMTSNYTAIAQAVNVREIALYQNGQPTITGQLFSDPGFQVAKKLVYRQMYYIGAIAPGATLTVAHGITGLVQFTHMYGTVVTNAVDYRPIPFASTAAFNQQISLGADSTNFYVSNGAGAPAITSGIVVLEYLLN